MNTTDGHPGTWNDISVSEQDRFVQPIHDGTKFSDYVFELSEYCPDGNIKQVKYKGVWLIGDNGYTESWTCIQFPMKDPLTLMECRYSKWLESMRKDIECVFGRMKKRYLILKTGSRFKSIKSSDKVFKTVCALHNRRLIYEGLDKNWEGKESVLLKYHPEDFHQFPKPSHYQNGFNFDPYTVNGYRIVHEIPIEIFQQFLIQNFHIRFFNRDIKFPFRSK